MIETHSHLNFHAFQKDVDEVIKNAFEAGVTKIINVGADLISSRKAIELAEKYDNLYATVGIHPHHADKLNPKWEDDFLALAQNPKVIAIGECGLDYFRYKSNGIVDPTSQRELFIKEIKIAQRLKLPLIIHNRQAGEDILGILLEYKSSLLGRPGVFHCMSGNVDLLEKVLDLGFYVGFDGNITYKGIAPGEETDLKELVKRAPIERILTETDSPFLTPQPHRGSRNEPKYAILVAKAIAEIKDLSFEKVDEQTEKNAVDLFQV